jgi:hypothetical protein
LSLVSRLGFWLSPWLYGFCHMASQFAVV